MMDVAMGLASAAGSGVITGGIIGSMAAGPLGTIVGITIGTIIGIGTYMGMDAYIKPWVIENVGTGPYPGYGL